MSEPLPVTLYWVLRDDCGFIVAVFPFKAEKQAREYAASAETPLTGPIEVCPGGIQGHIFYERP